MPPYNAFAVPAAFIGFNWIYAYGLLSSRTLKQIYGLDHNGSPRQDLNKYGEAAVKDGKITRAQLDMMKRCEAASANSVEGFTLFFGSVLFALNANVPTSVVSKACAAYTAARLLYGPLYILVADDLWSQARGLTWWAANASCLYLLYQGATTVL